MSIELFLQKKELLLNPIIWVKQYGKQDIEWYWALDVSELKLIFPIKQTDKLQEMYHASPTGLSVPMLVIWYYWWRGVSEGGRWLLGDFNPDAHCFLALPQTLPKS